MVARRERTGWWAKVQRGKGSSSSSPNQNLNVRFVPLAKVTLVTRDPGAPKKL